MSTEVPLWLYQETYFKINGESGLHLYHGCKLVPSPSKWRNNLVAGLKMCNCSIHIKAPSRLNQIRKTKQHANLIDKKKLFREKMIIKQKKWTGKVSDMTLKKSSNYPECRQETQMLICISCTYIEFQNF